MVRTVFNVFIEGTLESESMTSLRKVAYTKPSTEHSPVASIESGIAFQAPERHNKTLLHSESSAVANNCDNGTRRNGGSVGLV